MSEDQKKALEQQLWNIANTLRGKMNADEFRDYILGFIFYKYLSEKMDIYANTISKWSAALINKTSFGFSLHFLKTIIQVGIGVP